MGLVPAHFARSIKQAATWSPGEGGHRSFQPALSCPCWKSPRDLFCQSLGFSNALLPFRSSPVTGAAGALVFMSEPPTPTAPGPGQSGQEEQTPLTNDPQCLNWKPLPGFRENPGFSPQRPIGQEKLQDNIHAHIEQL